MTLSALLPLKLETECFGGGRRWRHVRTRPSQGSWSKPALVVPGVYNTVARITFVIDSQGDAAILWTSGALRGTTHPTQINAIRRSAGDTWGPQEIVAHHQWAALDDAVLADNGDLIVARLRPDFG
jgi:hypothetical protein